MSLPSERNGPASPPGRSTKQGPSPKEPDEASVSSEANNPRQPPRLVRYWQQVDAAREALAASRHPNGVPDHMTGETAQLDRIYVSGAILRKRDPEIRRLRRIEKRSATLVMFPDDDGEATS
jgi:hypothetical protein